MWNGVNINHSFSIEFNVFLPLGDWWYLSNISGVYVMLYPSANCKQVLSNWGNRRSTAPVCHISTLIRFQENSYVLDQIKDKLGAVLPHFICSGRYLAYQLTTLTETLIASCAVKFNGLLIQGHMELGMQ